VSDQAAAKTKKLTPRQELFCHEYIKDKNGKQAAIRAGFKEKAAAQVASRLLTYVNVKALVDQLSAKVLAAHEVDAAYVIKGFKGLAEDIGVESKVRATCYEKLADILGMFNHEKKVDKTVTKQTQELPPATLADLEKLSDDELERLANGQG
jgi:hypothetical protein